MIYKDEQSELDVKHEVYRLALERARRELAELPSDAAPEEVLLLVQSIECVTERWEELFRSWWKNADDEARREYANEWLGQAVQALSEFDGPRKEFATLTADLLADFTKRPSSDSR